MLDSLSDRSSTLICKLGMPLVYAYHLVISSIFFNVAADDATGLEKWANVALAPMQYFFEGKRAIPICDENNRYTYRLERRFDYQKHFFIKTAASFTALPASVLIGGGLKALSHLSHETRQRCERLKAVCHSTTVHSNLETYRSYGLQMEDFATASLIESPHYKCPPKLVSAKIAQVDLEALNEIVRILHKNQIPFWLDCGSLLGAYRHGGSIPHDWDIDIGVLLPDFKNIYHALQELDPEKFVVQDWSGRARPESYLKVYVRETGGMIDIYHFSIDPEKKEIGTYLSNEFNIFAPHSWIAREKRYCTPMPFDYIFPLKRALFEGIEVPVPGQTEKYLQVFYGENLAPAMIYNEITQSYEKDLTHPYWNLSNAH